MLNTCAELAADVFNKNMPRFKERVGKSNSARRDFYSISLLSYLITNHCQ